MDYIVSSTLPNRRQITAYRVDGVAKPETAIRRAQKHCKWPDDAILTAAMVDYSHAEIVNRYVYGRRL